MIKNFFLLLKTTFLNSIKNQSLDYSKWVFSSSFNEKFNYNSSYLFKYVFENEPNIIPLYVINDDKLRKSLQEKYGEKYFIETKTISGIKQVLNAGVWFTSSGLPVYGLGLNKKRLIVNLWHGVPLKKIGLMENNINIINRLYFKFIFSNNYTHILTTTQNLVSIMRDSFNVKGNIIKVWGQPRNDAIFKKNNREEILASIFEDLPIYKNIILYAPTYRENTSTIFFPFIDFNKNELFEFLEKEKLIIFIRCHQSETQKAINISGNRVKFINSDKVEEIMDIINIFDLLITDYSSIYIDYLLTEKPIIFLPYDKKEYINQRGFNFDYESVTPGPKPETFSDFKNEIIKLLNERDYMYLERKRTNLFFNDIRDVCSPKICIKIKEFIKEENSL